MKIGDIFYGVHLSAINEPIEVYEVIFIQNNKFYQSYNVDVEPIIGTTGIFTFPFNFDLDNDLLTAYYSYQAIWIYSKNIDLIVELNEKLLNGENVIEDISLEAWDIWDNRWIHLDPNYLQISKGNIYMF